MKQVNWKATAKTGELMVNTYDSTRALETRILLDLETDTEWKDNGVREEAIRVAATLFSLFVEKGVVCSLYTNGRDIITGESPAVSGGGSASHVRGAKEMLARLDLTKMCAPAEELTDKIKAIKDTQYIFITSENGILPTCGEAGKETDGLTVIFLHRPDGEKAKETDGLQTVNWEVRYG